MLEEETKPVGRPTDYTPELGEYICELISQGKSLNSICNNDERTPASSNVFKWLIRYPEFREKYEIAISERTEAQQELLLETGDEAIKHAEVVDPKASGAIVNAYKLKADNMKWVMSKMKPKKYGEKLDVMSDGKAIQGNTIIFKDFKGDTEQ